MDEKAEGELTKLILQGKIGGNYAREMVDLSYVWSALSAAKQEILACKNYYAMLNAVEKWFGALEK